MPNRFTNVFKPLYIVIGVLTRTKKFIFRTVRRLPYIGKQIDAEVEKQCLQMEKEFHEAAKGQSYLQNLPADGMSEVNLLPKSYIFVFLKLYR